jgi:SM-20-related protein
MTQVASTTAAACPHIVFRDVFGASFVADLLDYVAARQADFKSTIVRDRTTGERRSNYDLRSSVSLRALGSFASPFSEFVGKMGGSIIAQLRLPDSMLEPKEFEIGAYRDGDHFRAHIDTNERLDQVRVVSCVYYFARTPRQFSGGELRLFAMPTLSATNVGQASFADIIPETDTMVAFPSWLRHEVLPVRVPSKAWMDSRFTLNCWLHRA